MKDGRPLGLGPHHPVQCAELTNRIGRAKHRSAPNTRIAVGGISCVQFIGAAKPLDRLTRCDRVIKWEREITGQTETVGDAQFGEPLNGIFRYCLLLHYVTST